jgi:hypothetical protein
MNDGLAVTFDSDFPFKVQETNILHDIPIAPSQNLPGNKSAHRLILAVTGEAYFTINEKSQFHLNEASTALYVPPENDIIFALEKHSVIVIHDLKEVTDPKQP